MRRHCILTLLVASLLALPAHAEDITLTVHGGTAAGTLPTYFEPSAFFGWTSIPMKFDFATDAVISHGLIVESTQLLLGPSVNLADYQTRLEQSGFAIEAALAANTGAQFLLQVHGMPRWISKSSVINTPPGCEEEWPTYQTVAPDPAKWALWEQAIAATVTYFNVTHGLTNVWYQFWEEPDAPCFWTDTEANFLETWRHFVAGARSADPTARVGGPEPAAGPDSIKLGTSWAVMPSFIQFSATQGIRPDFISYHLFGNAPEQNRRANRRVLDLLSANGFAPVPIIVGSWNPLSACFEPNEQRDDPSWPSPPSALGCWQTDNEMGASYSLAFMAHLAESGVGYQAMYQLDDADFGGSEEFPHDWGLRTNKDKHGLRKAIYHAQTIVGRLPRSLVSTSAAHPNGADEYFPHVYAMAGVEGDRLGMLLWSYVTSPGLQAVEVLRDMGYGPADFVRWGGQTRIAAFLGNALPVSALTSVPSEQADLEHMKVVFYRQRALVTETNHVPLALDGFASPGGYRVTRWLIDATHNNTYGTYVASGLGAAIASQGLQQLDTQLVTDLSQIPAIDLAPYAVMLLDIERVAGTGGCGVLANGTPCDDQDPCTPTSTCQDSVCVGAGDVCTPCTSPSTIGGARLDLRRLLAPSGDDQLKLGGIVTVTTSPPLDLVAQGLRLILTTNAGVSLADLTAPAGSKWSVNRAGTAWKYRDPSASSGIVNAKVQTFHVAGTLRVKLAARGLALDAAPAGTPPLATLTFGAPIAAPGQCGVTAFGACRTAANGATMRCP